MSTLVNYETYEPRLWYRGLRIRIGRLYLVIAWGTPDTGDDINA